MNIAGHNGGSIHQ